MYIKELHLKNFGKFHNKKMELQPGINLIYGDNESGKTTLFQFIQSMFFGIERQRGRAGKFDVYHLYEPWNMPIFYEGEIRFSAGGKNFRIERGFHKAQSTEKLINEDDAEELSIAHGDLGQILDGLNESIFRNTMAIGQLKSEADQSLSNELKNYTAGFALSLENGINVGKALERLMKRKKEYEGKLRDLLNVKQRKVATIEKEKEYIQAELFKKRNQLKEYVSLHKNRKRDLLEQSNERHKAKKKSLLIGGAVLGSIIILGTATFVILLQELVMKGIAGVVGICLLLGLYLICRKRLQTKEDGFYQRDGEINRLIGAIQELKEDIHDKEVMLSNVEERLAEIEEEHKKEADIRIEIEALSLAYEKIQEASLQLQQEMSQALNQRASEILSHITNQKYEDMRIDSNIDVKLNTRDKILYPEQVSKGTVEEINFAIRMAFLEAFFPEESMPIFLDDAFVMYDEARLRRTLQFLADTRRQIIILTCHKRERELLEQTHIPFHAIQLI